MPPSAALLKIGIPKNMNCAAMGIKEVLNPSRIRAGEINPHLAKKFFQDGQLLCSIIKV
jgi:hypothetical protein